MQAESEATDYTNTEREAKKKKKLIFTSLLFFLKERIDDLPIVLERIGYRDLHRLPKMEIGFGAIRTLTS